jgi:hypothetical protein
MGGAEGKDTQECSHYSSFHIFRCTGVSSAIFCLFMHQNCRILQRFAEERAASYLLRMGRGTKMAADKELETGLRAMADSFQLPGGGRMKLSRLVAEHLGWFDAAERRGMSWRDVIRALTAAGVTGKGGKPLSAGTLSSTVWRKRAEAEVATDHASHPLRFGSPVSTSPHLRTPAVAKRPSAGQPQSSKRTASRPAGDKAQASRQATKPSKGPASKVRARSRDDVLAFMDRARAVRRRSD